MMSDEIKIENGEDFAAMLEESFKTLNNGEKVTGTVVGSFQQRRTGRSGR